MLTDTAAAVAAEPMGLMWADGTERHLPHANKSQKNTRLWRHIIKSLVAREQPQSWALINSWPKKAREHFSQGRKKEKIAEQKMYKEDTQMFTIGGQ